jgi:hypothetical protein
MLAAWGCYAMEALQETANIWPVKMAANTDAVST